MHVFKLRVVAGPHHPTHLAGIPMDAHCLVNSADAELARRQANERLAELGWESATFDKSTLLPPNPDLSGQSATMLEAYALAKRLGVSLVVYTPRAGNG